MVGEEKFFSYTYYISEVLEMDGFDKTMKFSIQDEKQSVHVNDVLLTVYDALQEKGYNPINQIVGYLLSGDPAYIPRHKDARSIIRKLERDELIEELVKSYLKHHREEFMRILGLDVGTKQSELQLVTKWAGQRKGLKQSRLTKNEVNLVLTAFLS